MCDDSIIIITTIKEMTMTIISVEIKIIKKRKYY